MKIPGSIRNLYAEQRPLGDGLKERVDALFSVRLHDRWHYESRVKEEESFALKVESGRFRNVSALEDFFAATIVVRNTSEIPAAEALVHELFTSKERRPEIDAQTKKTPDQFVFDDLRLYVEWIDDPTLPATGLAGRVFEVQIKTFLQHAWSIATHDLIYKSDAASWSMMRISFQIKAMLEHAEVSIQEAAVVSASSALNKTDDRTALLNSYINVFTALWQRADLPVNIRGLAENAMIPAKLAGISPTVLQQLLISERDQGRGPLTLNLSPYGVVVQTVLNHRRAELEASLAKYQKKALVLTRELDIPTDMPRNGWGQSTIVID